MRQAFTTMLFIIFAVALWSMLIGIALGAYAATRIMSQKIAFMNMLLHDHTETDRALHR
jgi:flagellar biosynthesis protein FliQ